MKTVLNVKTDVEVKKEAQKTAKELGVPLSMLVNAYLKQFIRDKELSISIAPRMTPALERIIGRAEKDLRANRNISPIFSDPEKMDEYLGSL